MQDGAGDTAGKVVERRSCRQIEEWSLSDARREG